MSGFVQSRSSGAASLAFVTPNTAGNCLVVALQTWGPPGTISDTLGNHYTQIASQFNNDPTGGRDDYTTVWIAPNSLIGPNTVMATGPDNIILVIAEYSGVYTAAPLDVYQSTYGTNPTVSITTTTWSDQLLLIAGRATGVIAGNTFQQTGGYTMREDLPLGSGGTFRELALWDSFALTGGTYSNTVSLPLGFASIAAILIGLKAAIAPASQRGNIDYDQIRTVARLGNGSKIQMFGGGTVTAGHVAVYDPAGNVVDGGFSGSSLIVGFTIGNGSTGTNVGPMLAAPHAGNLTQCVVTTKASDATTALTFTIKRNGISVFATNPTVTAGTTSGTVSTFTSLASVPLPVSPADVFSMDITSGGSAWQFTAQLE